MMKKFGIQYFMALAAILTLAACHDSDTPTGKDVTGGGEGAPIKIHLRVSQAKSASGTRAISDPDATDAELMNVWTVVAVHDDTPNKDKVAAIYACKPTGDDQEIDDIDDIVELTTAGKYRFYSFANMSPQVVMNLLGITGTGAPTAASSGGGGGGSARTRAEAGTHYGTSDQTSAGGNDDNTALNDADLTANGSGNEGGSAAVFMTDGNTYPVNTIYKFNFSETTLTAETVAAKTVNVAGNNFDITAAENGFGAKGIPMSNVQTIEVEGSGSSVDLIVIRMMAKIELQIYNATGTDITLNSFSITDITKNENANLKLLPSLTNGHDTMESSGEASPGNSLHGDIQPNLGSTTVTQGNMTLYPSSSDNTISATTNKYPITDATTQGPKKFIFYVNESVAPKNEFGRFFLKLNTKSDGGTLTEERYVLIDDANQAGKTGSWNYIARNDYRIIPIVLDDYKLDIIPYDFPPIGVYPATVKEEDGLYTINFHDYGHIHLVPQVTKLSDNSVVPFTSTVPSGTSYDSTSWGLMLDGSDNPSFTASWTSWLDHTKMTAATDNGGFYVKQTTVATKDACENGGWPYWDAATVWNGCNTSPNNTPYIFANIEDPGTAMSDDKKIYHEFSVNLYKQGSSVARVMTYRLYMILDKEQMMYARQHHSGASRWSHCCTMGAH